MKKAAITALVKVFAAVLLVLAGLAVAALYYIGDRMVDSMVDSEIDSLLEEEPSDDIDASGTGESDKSVMPSQSESGTADDGSDAGLSSKSAEIPTAGEDGDKLSGAEDRNGGDGKSKGDKPVNDGSGNEAVGPKDSGSQGNAALPDSNEKNSGNNGNSSVSDEQNDKQKSEEKVQYSVEVMKDVKEKVTATDKISAAALLVKRLSPSDIKELQGMLSGGVNTAEKKRAKEIVYQRFTQDEIKTIKELYAKYLR